MNGIILTRSSDAIFSINGVITNEVIEYCKKQGYEIKKVVFTSSYDTDIGEVTKRISTKSSSNIYIIKEENKYVAVVIVGSYMEIE